MSATVVNKIKTVLKLESVKKSFGGVKALKGVDFELKEGEVHALLGENGAGKSTLIKILTGVYQMDSGNIIIKGNPVKVENPIAARFKGIAAIYQELSLVESLTVAQNIFLGHEPVKNILGQIDFKQILDKSLNYLKSFGIDIHPQTMVSDLGMGEKRILEIVKALSINANILVLDEPTTGMSSAEIEKLFAIMDDMKNKQVNMIYITHYLDEVFRVCDRASVFRDGENSGTFEIKTTNSKTLIKAMLGKELKDEFPIRNDKPKEETLLEIKNYKTAKMKEPLSFHLKKGEILGITGIIGAGKSELALGLFGSDKNETGQIHLNGKEIVHKTPQDAHKNGFALIPEDRKDQGLFLNLSIEHNITVANIDKVIQNTFVSMKKRQKLARDTAEKLKVKPLNVKAEAQKLSGGNQQKVVVGKWLSGNPKIILMDEPTRGIDVGAKTEIFKLIQKLASNGVRIILFSAEFKEINGICDRTLILRKGSIVKELTKEHSTTEKILSVALGGDQ
ncbi:MAG: sugar ABC transporter ATP-binding protein [Thermotogota bacterium]